MIQVGRASRAHIYLLFVQKKVPVDSLWSIIFILADMWVVSYLHGRELVV